MNEQQQYMEPRPYWVLNAGELDRLRGRLREAEAAATKEKDWVTRTRAQQDCKVLERELRSAEFASKEQGAAQQGQARQQEQSPAGREVEISGRYIVSDDGKSFLCARNTAAPEPTQPVEYMPIEAKVVAGGDVQWPESFSERSALLQAAVKEVQRIGM